MSGTVTRRAALAGLAGWIGSAALADAPLSTLRPRARPEGLESYLASPETGWVRDARLGGPVSYALAEARGGVLISAGNAATALPPASVAKTVTALYALDTLGPQHRFLTRVLATGPVEDGVLQGHLIIAGGGDPTLQTDELGRLMERLVARGLREIRGGVQAWGGALPYHFQIDGDQMEHFGYNPAISGLSLNYNRVFFEWTPQGGEVELTLDARGRYYRPAVTMAKIAAEDRGAPVFDFDESAGRDVWSVAESALRDNGGRWLPVRYPPLYVADVAHVLLQSLGVKIGRGPDTIADLPPDHGTALMTVHESASLTDIAVDTLKSSNNLMAETIGLAATQARRGPIRGLPHSGREMGRWALETTGMAASFVDHSGLGDGSRVSARALVRLLASDRAHDMLKPLMPERALRNNQGGPVEHPVAGMLAKTGTLNFVAGLGGYLTDVNGKEHVFTIFSADLETREATKDSGMERPRGARSWTGRAVRMRQKMLAHWAGI
jgi:D-alanyl-D-alanine carboxypeptidase/D-alanyl-D-alanine-endopeptidase (penicillin-binding protein 4)